MPTLFHKLLFCLALGLVTGCQSELAKWEFAEAQLQAEFGDRVAAIPWMKRAVEQTSDDPYLTLQLAGELAELGDPESVQICDRVWAKLGANHSVDFRKYVQQSKIQCQQKSGDFVGALVSYKEFLTDHVSRDDNELNTLAYCRALAKQELRLAEANIERALEAFRNVPGWENAQLLSAQAKTSVAIALLARELDHQAKLPTQKAASPPIATTKRLTQAINFLEFQIEEYEILIQQLSAFPVDEERDRSFKHALAMLLTVRALIYQDQGDSVACNQYRYRVKQLELGLDADQIVVALPAVDNCLALLQISSMYLDTLGFIQSQMPWKDPTGVWNPSNPMYESRIELNPKVAADATATAEPAVQRSQVSQRKNYGFYSTYDESLRNMDLALEAVKIRRMALCGQPFNRADYPIPEVRRLQVEAKKNEATLRYHRLLIYQRQGETKLAEQEEQAILKLGFVPSDRLF